MAFERRGFSTVLVQTFIFLCSFFSFLSGDKGESDIFCLKSIKDSLEDPYDSLWTWDFQNQSKSYICQNFDGVTCNPYDDHQVLHIHLQFMWLKGQFPQGIANCSSLQLLNLSQNEISGYFPSHVFGMLPSLKELDLSDNEFWGEIPTSIGNLVGLSTLDLSYNEFWGEIPPSIGNLVGLSTLDLSDNKFWGEIPASIGNLIGLSTLDLSDNKFWGEIPPSIGNLVGLSTLDLSYNKFWGEILPSIGNLTGLNILNLNNNEFTGELPHQLGKLTSLTKFSVANNLLWGPVPVFSSNVTVGNMESYLNNSGLCGGPFKPCDSFHQSFREGLIAGYIFSAISVIVVYLSYFVPWTQLEKNRRKKPENVGAYYAFITKKRKKEEQKEENRKNKLHNQSLLNRGLQEKRCQEITGGLTCKMSFIELCEATDFFNVERAIGVGSIGIMYKARLRNGWFVAIKRLYDSQVFKRQFNLEIMILGRNSHRNIVPLLGFCVETVENVERKQRILVYKHMPNGRLSNWLSEGNGDVTLNWPLRVRIALGIARGLCWLHHNLHVVHFSISSEHILLDQNFEPKISNFGEARFVHQNIGNDLDMRFHIENWSNNENGFEKMDVYNFGTVLLELLAGKKVNPMTDYFMNDDDSVVSFTTILSESPSSFHEAIDKSLIGKGFDNEIFALLTIAHCCVQPFLDQRPSMLEVFNKMSCIWETHEPSNDFEMTKQSEIASATTSIDDIVEIESM